MKTKPRNRITNLFQLWSENKDKSPVLRSEEQGDEATVFLYGVIGDFFGDISAQAFNSLLAGIKASVIHLRIDSPGGDVFTARSMMTAIAQHSATVIAHVDGVAASAATGICMACDKVEISRGAFFMIHNAWSLVMGNRHDLVEMAGLLEKIDAELVEDYRRKTGKNAADIAALMDAETWFTAEEAVENKFADSLIEVVSKSDEDEEESDGDESWNLSAYDRAPAALKVSREKKPAPVVDYAALRASNERRLRLLETSGA